MSIHGENGQFNFPGAVQVPKPKPARPEPPKAAKSNKFKTLSAFKADDGSLSFPADAVVELVEKSDTGWWFVKYESMEGWGPADFFEPLPASAATTPANRSRAASPKPVSRTNSRPASPKQQDKGGLASVISQIKLKAPEPQPAAVVEPPKPAAVAEPPKPAAVAEPPKPAAVVESPTKEPAAAGPQQYVVQADYAKTSDTEVDLKKGERVTVDDQSGGWWFVTTASGASGWAPADYLEQVQAAPATAAKPDPAKPEPPKPVAPKPVAPKPVSPSEGQVDFRASLNSVSQSHKAADPVAASPPKAAVLPPKAPDVAPKKKPEVAPKQSLEVAAKKPPEVAAKKPPEVAAKKPEVAPKKPEVAPKKPEVAPKKPEVAPKKPEVAPKKPEVASKPAVASKPSSPVKELAAALQKKTSASPPKPAVKPKPSAPTGIFIFLFVNERESKRGGGGFGGS